MSSDNDIWAEFSINPPRGAAPLTVEFVNLSHGPIETWRFEFGDGDYIEDGYNTFTHVYECPGEYRPSLHVSRGTLTAGVAKRITVDPGEFHAGFTTVPEMGYPPMKVIFTDTTIGTPVAWSWDFGDGAASMERNPRHIYTHPGVYQPTLTSSDRCGTTDIFAGSPIYVQSPLEPEPDPEPEPKPVPDARQVSPIVMIGVGLVGYLLYRAITSPA